MVVRNAQDLLDLGGKSLEGVIYIAADIDLNGAAMPTIGAAYGKSLTVIGAGHTISNGTTAHTSHNGMKHHGFFYAYTNSTSPMLERLQCEKRQRPDGDWEDLEGNKIEDFDYPLNLMFSGTMKVADSFENMLKLARADFDAQLVAAGYEPFKVED